MPSRSAIVHPLQWGNVHLDFPVLQAALSGYGDWPARVLAMRCGAGATVAEVVLDRFVLDVSGGRKAKRFLRVDDEDRPCGGQLMGNDSEELPRAAVRLAELGFDWVELNFGCPVKKVLGKCRGGALLGHPEKALRMVQRVRDLLPREVALTLKMRRGVDDTAGSRDHFFEILDGAISLGIAGVTLHGRTVRQRYEGPSSWEFLAEVKRHLGDCPVLGSGDLFTAEACIEMMRRTGVDGVTVARGAIGNPWIFQQIRAVSAGLPLPDPPSLAEQRELIEEHYRLAETLNPPERVGMLMRKFGIKYARHHPQTEAVRAAFIAVRHREDWQHLLDRWYV